MSCGTALGAHQAANGLLERGGGGDPATHAALDPVDLGGRHPAFGTEFSDRDPHCLADLLQRGGVAPIDHDGADCNRINAKIQAAHQHECDISAAVLRLERIPQFSRRPDNTKLIARGQARVPHSRGMAGMRKEQEPIATWMHQVMKDKGLKPTSWARKAGLGADTVSRALKPDYEFVTTTTTLAKLAEAAGVEMPAFAGQSSGPYDVRDIVANPTPAAEMMNRLLPSAEQMAELAKPFLSVLAPDSTPQPQDLWVAVMAAYRDLLVLAAADRDTALDPAVARSSAQIVGLRSRLPDA